MYGRGHEQGTKTVTRKSQSWYAEIETANIQAAEDAERALVTALAIQVGNAVSAMPDAAERIRKAATLVQRRHVLPLEDGSWLVAASQAGQPAYHVTRGPWRCECPDHQQRERLCKHLLAAQMTVKVGNTYQAITL